MFIAAPLGQASTLKQWAICRGRWFCRRKLGLSLPNRWNRLRNPMTRSGNPVTRITNPVTRIKDQPSLAAPRASGSSLRRFQHSARQISRAVHDALNGQFAWCGSIENQMDAEAAANRERADAPQLWRAEPPKTTKLWLLSEPRHRAIKRLQETFRHFTASIIEIPSVLVREIYLSASGDAHAHAHLQLLRSLAHPVECGRAVGAMRALHSVEYRCFEKR